MNEQIYTNYRLQLPDQEILGTLFRVSASQMLLTSGFTGIIILG